MYNSKFIVQPKTLMNDFLTDVNKLKEIFFGNTIAPLINIF